MEEISTLINDLNSADVEIRRNASEDLGYCESEAVIQPLISMLNDSSRAVSETAAESLIMIGTTKVAESLVPLLSSEIPSLRIYAVEIMSQLEESSIQPLTFVLEDEDHDVRKFAVDILDRINLPQCVPYLLKALDDPDVNISSVAAEAIGRLGDESVVPAILEHLHDAPWMKGACLRALGEIGTERARKSIHQQIEVDRDPVVILSAIQALGKIGHLESIEILLDLLKNQPKLFGGESIIALESIVAHNQDVQLEPYLCDISLDPLYNAALKGDFGIRLNAIRLIGKLKYPSALPILALLYYDKDSEIRRVALSSVVALQPGDIQPLVAILKDPEAPMTALANALDTLGQLKSAQGQVEVVRFLTHEHLTLQRVALDSLIAPINESTKLCIKQMLQSPISEIVIHALKAVQDLNLHELIDDVIHVLHSKNEETRTAADEAFVVLASEDMESKIHPFLDSFDQDERMLAFRYFSDHDPQKLEEEFLKGLKDPDWKIRKISLKGIVNRRPGKAEEMIVSCLEDPNENVVISAIQAFATFNGATSQRYLATFLKKATHPRYVYETIEALGTIGSKESIPDLSPYLESSDTYLKLAAIEALKNIGGEKVFEELNKLYALENDDDVLETLEAALASLESQSASPHSYC
ncbi:HEAT repeat domain-containing protein [Deltaproteobacteria bacterium TL4]